MRRFVFLTLATALVLPVLASAPVQAQSTGRSWVSSTGDDSKDCTRAAPCATFAGAYGKTMAGGEISCVEPGSYGGLTIAKAITIGCEEGASSVFSFGTPITINAGASDAVYLKGLDLNGTSGTAGNPNAGIKFNSGKSLTIENCRILAFQLGVAFTPSGASFLNIISTTITNNGLPNTGGGIQIAPGASGYGVVSMTNVRIVGNYIGIGGSTTGAAFVQIVDSLIANNTGPAISVSGNVTVRLGSSTISGNGGTATSGNVLSHGDNHIVGNSPDTTPATIPLR